MIKKANTKNSVLWHYLYTYFIVFLVPVLICFAFFIIMISQISKEVISNKKNELVHASSLIDIMFDEVSYLGDSIVHGVEVNSFKFEKDSFEYPNSYKIIQIRKELQNYFFTNKKIYDYFILFNNSQIMISNKSAYTYENFDKLYLKPIDQNDQNNKFLTVVNNVYYKKFLPVDEYLYKEENTVRLMFYKQPLLSNSSGTYYGNVWIAIEEAVISAQMPPATPDSAQFIIDSNGVILYEKNNIDMRIDWNPIELLENNCKTQQTTTMINNEEYTVLFNKSSKSGLVLVDLQPKKYFNQSTINNVIKMLLFVNLAVAAGLCLSYYMSKKTAEPINKILKQIEKNAGSAGKVDDGINKIHSVVETLISNNSQLEDELKSQIPFIKNSLFNRLVYGDVFTEDELKDISNLVKFPLDGQIYTVLIFHIVFSKDTLLEKNNDLSKYYVMAIREVIDSMSDIEFLLYNGNNQIVTLINLPEELKSNHAPLIAQKVEKILLQLPNSVHHNIFAFAGNPVTQITKISESYTNALYVLKTSRLAMNQKVYWFANDISYNSNYPNSDFSVRLTHYILTGNVEGLEKELDEISEKYFHQDQLPYYLQYLFLHEIQAVMFRSLDQIQVEHNEFAQYITMLEKTQDRSLDEAIEITGQALIEICIAIADSQSQSSCDDTVCCVKRYIDDYYYEQDLSLIKLADMFSISDTYLSSVFKEQFDINISSYIETVRIEKAKKLLLTTSMSVTEIAQKVGYYSINSFSRAFKRVVGITATKFKEES